MGSISRSLCNDRTKCLSISVLSARWCRRSIGRFFRDQPTAGRAGKAFIAKGGGSSTRPNGRAGLSLKVERTNLPC